MMNHLGADAPLFTVPLHYIERNEQVMQFNEVLWALTKGKPNAAFLKPNEPFRPQMTFTGLYPFPTLVPHQLKLALLYWNDMVNSVSPYAEDIAAWWLDSGKEHPHYSFCFQLEFSPNMSAIDVLRARMARSEHNLFLLGELPPEGTYEIVTKH
jgi:hypothetical protein